MRQALDDSGRRDSGQRINLTDQDANLMRTRQGIAPGYNAQAMVSPLGPDGQSTGMPITAVDLVDEAHDHARLLPMPEQAGEITGVKAPVTPADAGHHSSTNLEKRAERDRVDHAAAWVHAVAGTPPRRAGTIAKPHAGERHGIFHRHGLAGKILIYSQYPGVAIPMPTEDGVRRRVLK